MAEYNDKSKITKAIPAEEDNIELVIKLPKEIYVASRMLNVKPDDVVQIPLEVITNGTPLPKGHGVLKDADVMINKLCTHEANELFGGITCAEILDFINYEKTIIEADKVERTNEEQVLNGFYEMMKGLWGNQDLKMPNSVSERPPADVVERSEMDKEIAIAYRLGQKEERSKIDKVIKEIRKLSPKPTAEDVLDGNPKKEAIWEILMEVEKILKRNLEGEM